MTRIKNLNGRVSRMEPLALIRRFFRGGSGWGSRYLRSAELVNHDQCKAGRKYCGGLLILRCNNTPICIPAEIQ
jgi:hypothetical protein